MLGKLMKYEWKDSAKMGGLVVLATVLVGIIGAFSIYLFLGPDRWNGDTSDLADVLALMGMLGIIVFMMCLVGVYYGMLGFQGVRFYRSMYGNEGYLTHTLPVNNHQLLFSKVLMGGIWMLITVVAMGVAVFIFAIGVAKSTGQDISLGWMLRGLWEDVVLELAEEMGAAVILYLFSLLIAPFATIMGLFGSITLGQLFPKHRGLMSIVCYMLYLVANWFIRMLTWANVGVIGILFVGSYRSYTSWSGVRYLISVLVTLAIGCGLYFLSHYINEQKLNLE